MIQTLLAIAALLPCQSAPPQLTAEMRQEVVVKATELLVEGYVFEDKARKAQAALQRLLSEGRLSETDPQKFAKKLEDSLRSSLADVHVSLFYDPALHEQISKPPKADPQAAQAERERDRRRNYGFQQVELLPGNIGYLNLTRMCDLGDANAGRVASSAMGLLSSSDAVIVDLRKNPGGSGRMVQFLASYFFSSDEDVWLISNQNRSKGTFRQEWTQPYVPGPRMPDVPLYIVVGPDTGSAAEGLAYVMQAAGRATIVGAKTAGGAHSGSYVPLGYGLVMFLPIGRTISPITNTNWEGVGVKPDVEVETAKAVEQARLLALEKLLPRAVEEQKVDAEWFIVGLRAALQPPKVPVEQLRKYAGTYVLDRQPTPVTLEGDTLYYGLRSGKRRLRPLGQNLFLVEGEERYGKESYRVRFDAGPDGQIVKVVTLIRHAPGMIATFEDPRAAG